MGVRVRKRNGAWWIFLNLHGRRKAKRVGVGPQAKKAAELAALKLRVRLAEGDGSIFEPTIEPRATTFEVVATEWLCKYPALHAIRPATLDNYR